VDHHLLNIASAPLSVSWTRGYFNDRDLLRNSATLKKSIRKRRHFIV
jgi:hypothetical protein